jgi:hypothetical protein
MPQVERVDQQRLRLAGAGAEQPEAVGVRVPGLPNGRTIRNGGQNAAEFRFPGAGNADPVLGEITETTRLRLERCIGDPAMAGVQLLWPGRGRSCGP